MRWLGPLAVVGVACCLILSPGGRIRDASAQDVAAATDAQRRARHAQVVRAMVHIGTDAGHGSGWLIHQRGRPLVITNRHVVPELEQGGAASARVGFYTDSARPPVEIQASLLQRFDDLDLAVLRLAEDPPESARPVPLRRSPPRVFRGTRVVLGGNPQGLPFQTTEGVVTGHLPGRDECGTRRNCLVVDAASLRGSSGGPVVSMGGEFIGMLWGGPTQARGRNSREAPVDVAAFSFIVHAQAIADALATMQRG